MTSCLQPKRHWQSSWACFFIVLIFTMQSAALSSNNAWYEQMAKGSKLLEEDKLAAAESYFRAALVEAEKQHVSGKQQMLNLSCLAQCRWRQGDYSEAEALYRRELAYAIEAKSNSSTSDALRQLGMLYIKEKRYQQAESFLEKLIRQEDLGFDDRMLLDDLWTLENCYQLLNKPTSVAEIAERRAAMAERLLGRKDAVTISAFDDNARALIAIGKYSQASHTYKKLVEILQGGAASAGMSLQKVLIKAGQCCVLAKEFDRAHEYFEMSMKIAKSAKDQSTYYEAFYQLADSFHSAGQQEKGEFLFSKILKEFDPKICPFTEAMVCIKLARCLILAGKPEEAQPYFDRGLSSAKVMHNACTMSQIMCESGLNEYRLGDNRAAEAQLKQGLELAKHHPECINAKEFAQQCYADYLKNRELYPVPQITKDRSTPVSSRKR